MKQATALNILKSGKNVFITGSAGTGKTYLLNEYKKYLRERRVNPTIVAPTGIAASHLGGHTIHSFFGLGLRDNIDERYVDFLLEKKYLRIRFDKLKLLIIDEVSMVSPELFSSMDLVLRSFKGVDTPFGGIQVVISGDFFQLPPISKEPKEKRFAWQSSSWKELKLETCYLQEKFRQDDSRLIDILDDIRSGNISEKTNVELDARINISLSESFKITQLYTHNTDVDRINIAKLNNLEGREKLFIYESKGSAKNIDKIFKSSLVLEELRLKKGALVIFIKNSSDGEYLNGTTGVVESFSPIDNMPIVITTQGRKIKLELEEWSLENDHGKVIATISQVPLRLAWAITIHKSQGMTLDGAFIDLSKTFEVGQGYVALSRIKNIDGLSLLGLNPMALRVDPVILYIDERIKQASVKANDKINSLSKNDFELLCKNHIISMDGLVDKQKIEEEIDSIKLDKYSSYVTPTHIKTKNLIEKSDTLIQLAINRKLAKSTIIKHLFLIKEEDPNIDLNKFKPKSEFLNLVENAVLKLMAKKRANDFTDNGNLRLNSIFTFLNGEVGYDDIRLCMLFL